MTTVRSRLFRWQVAIVVAALAGSAVGAYAVLDRLLDQRIDRELRQEVAELRALATAGEDPVTGRALGSVRELLQLSIEHAIPDRDEAALGIVDGVPTDRSTGSLRLDAAPQAVTTFVAAAQGPAGIHELAVPQGTLRYAAVPVTMPGEPERGVYVIGMLRDSGVAENRTVALVLAASGLVALLFATAAGWLVTGRALAPLDDVRRTARRITDTDLGSRIPVRGDNEIGELARTVNTMLDRLQRGFDEQRRFVDDAGHELRTPLTIVRGHLEVLDPDDAQDTRETVALVTDELDRMGVLVNDLLTLARADRPEFVRPEATDTADLLHAVLAKVSVLGDRDWRVAPLVEQGGPATVVADPRRITQALVQLAANAVQHTADGGTITLSVREEPGGDAAFTVADHGPGVPEEDRERVFQRFVHGREEGAGLGLAIVAAIARAHGGSAAVEPTPGGGATFVVRVAGQAGSGPADREVP